MGGDGGGEKTDLLVDRVALSEHKVAAEQPREKGIVCPLLPAVQLPLEEQECLIDRDKLTETRRVLLRCAEDGFEACRPAETNKMISASRRVEWARKAVPREQDVLSATKQDGHDQCMGKPNLDAVYETIACTLENGKVVMVLRVGQDGLNSGHG